MLWLALLFAATPTDVDVHARMRLHFDLTDQIQRSVIRGDLDGVHEAAGKLRSLPNDDMPESWKPWMDELTLFSREAARAESIPAAATALAALGESCASCHEATMGGPHVSSKSVPPQDWTDGGHMQRHEWAIRWMWLGVIKPNTPAYDRGAAVLAEQPLLSGTDHPGMPEAALGLEERIHETAARAREASDAHTRADLYAELLAPCGTCHISMEAEAETP